MTKEIPEELKNYNKYPGEQVRILPEEIVKIGEKNFRLIKDFKSGFDALALEQRYGHVFDKFDYVVGDWGHELLRLKGFYELNHKKIEPDEKIDHLADYLQEYCAYGCAYFILQRLRAEGEVDEPFIADKEDLRPPKKIRQQKTFSRENHQNKRKRDSMDQGFSTVRPDVKEDKPRKENKSNLKRAKKSAPQKSAKKFVIRERKDK